MADKEKQDRRPIYSPVKFVKTVWTLLSFWSNVFIRKLQQQHQIKTMYMCANIEDCSKTPAQPSPAAQTPSTSRLTKNSLKAANDTTSSVPKPATPAATSASVQQNTENIIISSEISVKKEEQHSDVNSSSSAVILNHQLSARLIKSMPQQSNKTNSSTSTTTKTAYQM